MTVTTINCDISWENSKLDFHRQLKNEGAILVYLCTYFLSFQFIFKCLAALNIWKYVYRPAIFWNIALFRQQNKTIQFKLQWIDNGMIWSNFNPNSCTQILLMGTNSNIVQIEEEWSWTFEHHIQIWYAYHIAPSDDYE